MAEDYDVPLPTYSGRLSNDWSSHEARLKAWLRIKGIPQHAREAADVLTLSLEPRSNAALTFDYASPVERQSFDDGVLFLRAHFDSLLRKQLAQGSARNALDTRTFRERGRRKELVKDLLGDLEPLMRRVGLISDHEKREAFIRTFVEFPRAVKNLSRTATFDEAVAEALRWEAIMIQKELELNARARQPRKEEPSSTRSHHFHPSGIPPPRPPSPSHSPSALKSTHIPHPIAIPTPTASAPHSAPPPESPTLGAGGAILLSRRISTTGGPSSAPSTIDEGAESSDLFGGRPSTDRDRPPNPTPNGEATFYLGSPVGTSTAGLDPHTPNFDTIDSRRSMSYLRPSQYEADQYDDEYSVPVRSRSVDFARSVGRGAGRGVRELRISGVDVDEEGDDEEEDGDNRSRSTPPFITDALHSDQEGEGPRRERRSASALEIGEGPRRDGGRRKLVRRPSSKKHVGRGDAMSDASTVTKASRIKSWFTGRSQAVGKETEGREGALSPFTVEGDRRSMDHEGAARRARLGVSAAWSRSVERLTRSPSPGPEVLGRPAKVRGGGRGSP